MGEGTVLSQNTQICPGGLMKTYVHRPTKVLPFLTRGRFQKYFSAFNNTPPPTWVAHIASNICTWDLCSYYNFMLLWIFLENINQLPESWQTAYIPYIALLHILPSIVFF